MYTEFNLEESFAEIDRRQAAARAFRIWTYRLLAFSCVWGLIYLQLGH